MRECQNSISLIGRVKSKTVKRGAIEGVPTISIDLVVQSKKDETKINETKVSFFAKNSSKLYAGYETLANELRTDAEHGTGERVRVTGSITMNEFMSQTGEFISRNKVRGIFCNRLPETDTTPDTAGLVIECIITAMVDEMKDGRLTGRKNIQALSVGYGDSIIELKDLIVGEDLAKQFAQIYSVGTTGKLFVEMNNYALVGESTIKQQVQAGFGQTLAVMPDVVKEYVNNLQIVGGDMPNVATNYSAQDIQEIQRLRNVAIQKAMSTQPKTQNQSQAPNGFGAGFGSTTSMGDFAPLSDSEMPF